MFQIRIDPLLRGEEMGGAIIIINDITEEWKAEQDKNRFVSMGAHELKSPIAAIINYIDVIKTGMFDNQVPKIHELLERCKIRGEALLKLVRDLLYINKREAGRVEKSIESLDLREVLEKQQEFYRIRNKNTSGISGTGLGLTMVKRVLTEYNGRITVDSVLDKGSTFTVYFPAAS